MPIISRFKNHFPLWGLGICFISTLSCQSTSQKPAPFFLESVSILAPELDAQKPQAASQNVEPVHIGNQLILTLGEKPGILVQDIEQRTEPKTYLSQKSINSIQAFDTSIVVGTRDFLAIRADQADGFEPKWQTDIGALIHAKPIVEKNAVYLQTMSHKVLKLDWETGEILWVTSLPESGEQFILQNMAGPSLRYENETTPYLFATNPRGNLVKLDTETGAVLAGLEPISVLSKEDRFGTIVGQICHLENMIVFSYATGLTAAVDPQLKQVIWSNKFSPIATTTCTQKTMFLGGLDGRVHTLDPRSGNHSELHNLKTVVSSLRFIQQGIGILVATSVTGSIVVYDIEHEQALFADSIHSRLLVPSLWQNNKIHLFSGNGNIYILGQLRPSIKG